MEMAMIGDVQEDRDDDTTDRVIMYNKGDDSCLR